MIKLVIFDLDGTLMNAYPAVLRSINYTLKKLGFQKRNYDTIRRAVGWGDSSLLRGFVGADNLKKAIAIYRPHHALALKTGTTLLPGAKNVLNKLKRRGYLLAVASNRPTRFSLIALHYLKIKSYFDYVLCADKVKKGKPAPDIFQQILKKFSLKPREALYVGDMTIDVVAGKKAKIPTAAVLTGSCSRAEIARLKPKWIIKDVSQIPDILDTLPPKRTNF